MNEREYKQRKNEWMKMNRKKERIIRDSKVKKTSEKKKQVKKKSAERSAVFPQRFLRNAQ